MQNSSSSGTSGLTIERIAVNRQQVIDALKKNRQAHRVLFDEAVDGYRKKMTQLLDESLTRFRSTATATGGSPPSIRLPKPPRNWLTVYDKYIGLFEMSSDPTLMLSVENYTSFVQDRWTWRGQFLSSVAPYSVSLAKSASAGSSN